MPFNYVAVVFLIGIVIIITTLLKSADRKRNSEWTEYFERERKANFSPKKEIPEELFFKADFDLLNKLQDVCGKNDELLTLYNNTIIFANKKMLKFEQVVTNTEIKLRFGASNFEAVTSFENNFERFLSQLIKLAVCLKKHDENEYAEIIHNYLHTIDSKNFWLKQI